MTLTVKDRQILATEQLCLAVVKKKQARILCTGLRAGARPITITIDLPKGIDRKSAILRVLDREKVTRVTKVQVHRL